MKKIISTPLGLIVSLAGLALIGILANGGEGWPSSVKSQTGAVVQQGPLTISVIERGNLSARNSAKVVNQLEGQSQILYLIEEGTNVVKGQLVVELDASELIDEKIRQEISTESAKAELINAEQEFSIQESQNISDVAAAQQSLAFAKTDLEKYVKGDWPQSLQKADEAIELAKEELAQAKDRLEWSIKLHERGFLTRTELEKDELQFSRNKILLEQDKRTKSLSIEYDNPKQLAILNAAVTEAERELERVILQAEARLVDKKSSMQSSALRSSFEEERLAKLNAQIEKAKIYSPEDGIVVYSQSEGRRGDDNIIEEGARVYERQELMTIPKKGGMLAEVKLHESVLKKVQEGQECLISVDAIPGVTLKGKVDFVALLPDKNSWWANPNQRLFRTRISIDGETSDMRPGMSCSVEIIVSQIDDTIFIPVQSAFNEEGRSICFVDGKSVEVELGQSNDKWVEVISGLTVGDQVSLSPPPDFLADQTSSPRKDDSNPEDGPTSPSAHTRRTNQ